MTAPPPRADNPAGRFFGVLLMAVGGLIAGLCGLCSLGFLLLMLSETRNGDGVFESIFTVGLIGGIPIAVGVGVFVLGLNLLRRSRAAPSDPSVFN